MLSRLSYFLPVVVLFLCSCSPEETTPAATIKDWITLRIGETEVEVQVALTNNEMRKGLMYREEMAPNRGMLFAYRQPQQGSFWMANTPLPLDIGFFDREGVLLEIHRMVPYDTQKTRSRSMEVQFALEMHQGWFGGQGIFPGTRLDMESLARALQRRGADPLQFGLDPAD